jgi:parallel beta-helix repeat protein
VENGNALIEFGGSNSNQTIKYVRSYNPRGWSCMHIAEGGLSCNNVTVEFNDVGPCGHSKCSGCWADGMSVSCQNSIVRNNRVNGSTDGGLVLFGAPGTKAYNNIIQTWNVIGFVLLDAFFLIFSPQESGFGGINMVDYLPWSGNFTDTVVYNNTIVGGISTGRPSGKKTLGPNTNGTMFEYVL